VIVRWEHVKMPALSSPVPTAVDEWLCSSCRVLYVSNYEISLGTKPATRDRSYEESIPLREESSGWREQ